MIRGILEWISALIDEIFVWLVRAFGACLGLKLFFMFVGFGDPIFLEMLGL